MRIPADMAPKGQPPFKGYVYLSSVNTDDVDLLEYDRNRDGDTLTCFALTAPGDVLQLQYAITSGSADFIDVIVDGVRRFSVARDPAKREFRGLVKRVLNLPRTKGTKRGGLKTCQMQVKSRDMDTDFNQDANSSLVGTIMFQAFRKETTSANAGDDSVADRYPDFEQCATWDETEDHNAFEDGEPATSMEIDLIDGTKAAKALREKVQKSYSADYTLLATIIFKLRTTAELRSMDVFDEVPEYKAPEHITTEQKRAIKATTPKSKKEDDASSIAEDEEDDEEMDNASIAESSKKSASVANSAKKSVASSAKKTPSKTPKGKAAKIDTPSKSTGKKNKTVKVDTEEEQDGDEEEEPKPKVVNKSASKPPKAKATTKKTLAKKAPIPAKTTSAKVLAKAISISSESNTDDTNEDEEETKGIAVKAEKQTFTQPPSRAASVQKEVSIEDTMAYMEAEDAAEGQDNDIFFNNPFEGTDTDFATFPNIAENSENAVDLLNTEIVGHTENMENGLGSVQVQKNLEIATSNELEEGIEEAMMTEQHVEVHDTTAFTTPQKKKPLSLQGSPEAPAYHAWLKRDMEIARLATEVEESRSATALPTALKEADFINPSQETVTQPAAVLQTTAPQATAINTRNPDNMSQDLGDITMADGLDDSYDDDLEAAQRTPSRGFGRFGDNRQIDTDVSPFTVQVGRTESVILGATFENNNPGGDNSQEAMRQVEDMADDASQATDVAPLEEILASVAASKRDGAIDSGTFLGHRVDDDEVMFNGESSTNKADGAQVPARSATPAVTTSKTMPQVIIETRATSTSAKVKTQDVGEVISQSQISTQSHDSRHKVSSSPVPDTAKVETASGQKNSSQDDSDDIILPKSKTTGTATAGPKKAKSKAEVPADATPEPDSKKKTPVKPVDKKKRVSVIEPPKQAANTTVKKSAEKRKSPDKTAEKRKSVGISDTTNDADSPRKSLAAPAGRNTAELEMITAKGKLEAAKKRNLELADEYKDALLAKDEREKAKQLMEQAEEVERQNAELVAQIAAIYCS